MAKPMFRIQPEPTQAAPPSRAETPDLASLPRQRVAELAARLSRTLGVARALAQNGRELDLSGFDDGIGRLCAQTLDLPAEEGRDMLPLLSDVLQQVDLLAHTLRHPPSPR